MSAKRISCQEILARGQSPIDSDLKISEDFYDVQTLAGAVGSGRAVCLVVACLAAGLAIVQAISTKPDVKLRLAHAAILFAMTAILVALAVQATEPDFAWRRAHA
jgi:uncharacterized protein involved in exopolysaccharide biosynthesis